jgi:hypothetical protein
VPKNAGTTHLKFGGRFWCLQNERGKWVAQYFSGFFHHIKVRQPIGRKDSIQVAWMRRLDGFLYEAAKSFELFQKFKIKIKKNQQPIAVYVLF